MLIDLQRQKIRDTVRSVQPQNKWKVLVLDADTRLLVENVLTIQSLLDDNVSSVESLESKRQPQTSFEAIYILYPHPHILECLVADFNRHQPRYAKPHVFFVSELPEPLFQRLKASPLRPHLQTVTDLYLDFHAVEDRLFSTGDTEAMQKLYNQSCHSFSKAIVRNTAQKLLNLCVTLQDIPAIRCYDSPLSRAIAGATQTQIDQYLTTFPEFAQAVESSGRPKAVLLIGERSMDVISPLIHEFTYQAMAYDILRIKGKTYKFSIDGPNGAEPKEATLNESDKLWVELRHQHMKDAIERITNDMERFQRQNPGFGESNTKATTVNDLKDMLAAMPHFAEAKNAFSLHLGMATKCMDIFQKSELSTLAAIEQDLATGFNSEGKPPKSTLEEMVSLLDSDYRGTDKLRLILLFIMYRDGIFDLDRRRLIYHSKLSNHDEQTMLNLEILGAKITREPKESTTIRKAKAKVQRAPVSQEEAYYDLSRYDPIIKSVLLEQNRDVLDSQNWPFIKETPATTNLQAQGSLRSARPTWAKPKSGHNQPRQRLIMFIAGAATYSESRACAEVSKMINKDVVLGSDFMLSPRDFLGEVFKLTIAREDLHLKADLPPPKAPRHVMDDDSKPRPSQTTNRLAPPSHQSHLTKANSAPTSPMNNTFPNTQIPSNPQYQVTLPSQAPAGKKKKRFGVF